MAEPAAWAWLAILTILLGFEGWAIATHNLTLSQWLWGWTRTIPLIRPIGIVSLVYLIYHLFFAT